MTAPRRTPPSSTDDTLRRIFDLLWAAYGPQHWWPGETPTEVVIGAILTQNTAWTNVERAIDNLRSAGCLSFEACRDLPQKELADLVRPAGTYRVKAERLKAFVGCLWEQHGGSLDAMLAGALDDARSRLLAVRGVGPETADAILLYAGSRPTFVVDAYTKRVLRRHLLIDRTTGYEPVRCMFQWALPADVPLFNEYHALLVAVGKRHCRATARCEACPLAGLPHEGGL